MIPLVYFGALNLLFSVFSGQSAHQNTLFFYLAPLPQSSLSTIRSTPALRMFSFSTFAHRKTQWVSAGRSAKLSQLSENPGESDSLVSESTTFNLDTPATPSNDPRFLSLLPGNWRVTRSGDVIHTLSRARSELRLGYSDIFETGGNAEKGGHGLSIRFQHNFGR